MRNRIEAWAETAAIGQQFVYGSTGWVAADVRRQAMNLSDQGYVMLFQRRKRAAAGGYDWFEYVAQRISKRAHSFIAKVSKSIESPHNANLAADFSED